MQRIVIVGAGECGGRAALALRRAGHDGPLTLVGEEPLAPYERPPLSKTLPPTVRPVAAEAAYADAAITLELGAAAVAIDRSVGSVDLSDGRRLAYDRLLLATGARPRRPPGMESAAVLRTARDAAAISERLVPGARIAVIGGGFIGLELAALAAEAGCRVTVVEAAPRLMARAVPEAIAAAVADRHLAAGVDLRLGAGIAAVDAGGVTLVDGGRLDADLVVAGVGAVPQTGLAEAAGLATDNGIVVDGRLATADPAIFAAGDCAAFPWRGRRIRLESWRNACDQAEHVAATMLGGTEDFDRVPWFWSDQFDLGLQVAGLPAPGQTSVPRLREDGALLEFRIDPDGSLAAVAGVAPGTAIARDIRLAEMIIARRGRPPADALADPAVGLKSLL